MGTVAPLVKGGTEVLGDDGTFFYTEDKGDALQGTLQCESAVTVRPT